MEEDIDEEDEEDEEEEIDSDDEDAVAKRRAKQEKRAQALSKTVVSIYCFEMSPVPVHIEQIKNICLSFSNLKQVYVQVHTIMH